MLLALTALSLSAQDWRSNASKNRLVIVSGLPSSTMAAPSKPSSATPNRRTTLPSILVIHEIFGTPDWPQQLADELRPPAISPSCPTCFPNGSEGGKGSSRFETNPRLSKADQQLNPDQITARPQRRGRLCA